MTTLTKALVALVLLFGVVAGVQTWRVTAAKRAGAAAAVAPAKAVAAQAKVEDQAAAATLAARIDTVTRYLTRTVHDTLPAAVLHPVTPADTSAAVAALPVVQQRYESCRVQLSALLTDCEAKQATALRRFAADSGVIAAQAGVIAKGLVPPRWSLSITAGYGGTFARDSTRAFRLYTGPSLTAGLSYRVAF